jgi:hypothetical protein
MDRNDVDVDHVCRSLSQCYSSRQRTESLYLDLTGRRYLRGDGLREIYREHIFGLLAVNQTESVVWYSTVKDEIQ